MVPCLTLLASHEGKHRLVDDLVWLVRHALIFEIGWRESLEDGAILVSLHPHRHRNLMLVVHRLNYLLLLYLGNKLSLDGTLHLCAYLIIYIGVSIEMTAGKGQFIGWQHLEWLICSGIYNLHFLTEIVIEIVMDLVATLFLTATEHINVIAALVGSLYYGSGTLLLGLGLWLDETHRGISQLFFLFRELLGRNPLYRNLWPRSDDLEGMLRHHHRITRHTIHHHRVVGWHLRIIFCIVETAIEVLANTSIRGEHISLAIKLQGDAIGMGMVAEASVERSHEVVLLVHTRAHGKPRHVWRIEHRARIFLYLRQRGFCIHGAFERIHLRDKTLVLMASGILQDIVDASCVQPVRMRIAEACNHTVREEIFRRCLDGIHQDWMLGEEVDTCLFVEHVGKVAEGTEHGGAIAWRLIPCLRFLIETEVDELVHAPLANAVLVDHIVEIILLALAIGICLVILQNQGYLHDEVGLKQIPIVVRHTIGDDILRPFLEACLDDRLVFFHQFLDEGVYLGQFVDDVLVDNLEGSHADKRLLMTMVEVGRHVAISDALHIDIQHLGSHLSVSHIARSGINAGGIPCNPHNLTVHTSDVATRLGWGCLFHLAGLLVNIGNATLLIIIVRHEVF